MKPTTLGMLFFPSLSSITVVSPVAGWKMAIDEYVVPKSTPAIRGGGGGNPYFCA